MSQDKNNLENQAQLLAGVLDSSLDGIYAFQSLRDSEGQIVDFTFSVVNRAAEKLVGRSADQLLGKRMLEMLPGNKADGLFDAYVQVVETGEPFVTEHYYEHDGLASWFRISASKCGDGFTVSFNDITDQKSNLQQLDLAVQRFELIVSGSSSGVWDWDCKTGALYWSARFKELLGYEEDEIDPVYNDFESRLHPSDKAQTLESLRNHLEHNGVYDVEYRLRRKDGSYVWCRASGQAQWDHKGKPVRMAGSIADISDQKSTQLELEQQTHRFDFAQQVSNTGMWDWRVDEHTVYYSDTWYTMLGYSPGELPMSFETWESLVHPDDVVGAKSAIERYLVGQDEIYACELRLKNNARQWQWVKTVGRAAQRDPGGKVTRIVGLHLDIHKQKIAQIALSEARDQAQQASAAKSAFVANMSHEIRTPMNAILGYADLLLDGDQSEADKRNHAQTIRRNGQHLMGIISDVLDISKIEAGKMSIEHITCSPKDIFADVINLMAPKADEKGIDLVFEPNSTLPPHIMTDPTRMRQVLLNLVGNAIKFTHQGSVQIRVDVRQANEGQIEITSEVVDTGIGIDDDHVERLFKPFNQADESTTRKFGGTGLGLAISRELCTMLGGELTCSSTPGKGSTFTARFLVGVAEHQAAAGDSQNKKVNGKDTALTGKRILVVEDGVDNQRLIQHYLKKAGAETDVAENGATGRDATLRALSGGNPFDIVLMDMQMPVLDGYSATRELREAGYTLPIIALTAHASANDRATCLESGCDDYLSKPIDRRKLIRTLLEHLEAPLKEGAGI